MKPRIGGVGSRLAVRTSNRLQAVTVSDLLWGKTKQEMSSFLPFPRLPPLPPLPSNIFSHVRQLSHFPSGDATPGRARSKDLAGRSTALAQKINIFPYLTADRFICFILIVKQSQRRWRPLCLRVTTKKRSSTFLRKKSCMARGCSDLEMTWLLCCAGAATAFSALPYGPTCPFPPIFPVLPYPPASKWPHILLVGLGEQCKLSQ